MNLQELRDEVGKIIDGAMDEDVYNLANALYAAIAEIEALRQEVEALKGREEAQKC